MHEQIEDLIDYTVGTSKSFAIWSTLVGARRLRHHRESTLSLENFFDETADAHFARVCFGVRRWFERREDTINLRGIITRLSPPLSARLQRYDEECAPYLDPIGRMITLCSTVYAHRSLKRRPEVAFKIARFTPELVGQLVSLGEDWTARIAAHAGDARGEIVIINDFEYAAACARAETVQLLDRLRGE